MIAILPRFHYPDMLIFWSQIYCLYIIDSKSKCLFFRDLRSKQPDIDKSIQLGAIPQELRNSADNIDSPKSNDPGPKESASNWGGRIPEIASKGREVGVTGMVLTEEVKLVSGVILSLDALINKLYTEGDGSGLWYVVTPSVLCHRYFYSFLW